MHALASRAASTSSTLRYTAHTATYEHAAPGHHTPAQRSANTSCLPACRPIQAHSSPAAPRFAIVPLTDSQSLVLVEEGDTCHAVGRHTPQPPPPSAPKLGLPATSPPRPPEDRAPPAAAAPPLPIHRAAPGWVPLACLAGRCGHRGIYRQMDGSQAAWLGQPQPPVGKGEKEEVAAFSAAA